MIKLTNILQEITIKGVEKVYDLQPPIQKLKNPEVNDTMESWMNKNNLKVDWDKYKLIQHRVGCSVYSPDILYSVDFNSPTYKKIFGDTKRTDKVKYEELLDKIVIRQIIGEWQTYFNTHCGENRVKVWIDKKNKKIRFILPTPSPADFKMLP